ncbi:complement factor H-like isoform X3 [Cyprinodon tularosa]|uniref:complement factor H-like isoform X3 n=1 Tax=Cyprinodon tularosa TaxID=77115 RepID=UPI0018E1DAB2|nr:complement factor H-like isoform X3 [Cyprinodon tularosa]
MCVRYLGLFLLLAWLPDLLQAELPCSPPELPDGYFVPEKNTYPHGETLTYSCEADFKPVVEGWWATSKCQNGKWSHTPQCIDKNSCLPPTIPNGKLEEMATSQNGWYEENLNIRVTCEDGFSLKGNPRTARCQNGEWYLPVCEKSLPVCSEPPKRLNAIVINQRYQEVFSLDTQVEYQCKDGYTTEQGATNKSVFCRAGGWTEGPTCKRPSACGRPPKIPNAVILQNQHQELFDEYSKAVYYCKDGFLTEDEERMKIVRCIFGNWTAGPTCTPSTRLGTRVTEPSSIPIVKCGSHPVVRNGEPLVYRSDQLKYTCTRYYKLVGPEIVRCRSDLTWSELPRCKENYCLLRNGAYEELILTRDEYILNNEQKEFDCLSDKYWYYNYSVVRCIDQKLHVSRCCNRAQINLRMC